MTSREPETKTNFTSRQKQTAVDKIDLLFAIDNSASMGDKQQLLSEAVPDLLARLLTPDCVDPKTKAIVGASTLDASGKATCPAGTKPEFPSVHDLHIAVVSSSLGARGGNACDPDTTHQHTDDRAHLLNRVHGGGGIANAEPSSFLAWLPGGEENVAKPRDPRIVGAMPYDDGTRAKLASDFQDLIVGVGEDGCGFEAQLESVYRFLIQPDPYDRLTKDEQGVVHYEGVDTELLKQRHDFLRPDSLLAVVMITDEDESSVAPTAFGGKAWLFENADKNNPTVRPGTQICATSPNDPACRSCYFAGTERDPNCANNRVLPPSEDNLNLRFYRMKERFGVDPRYPTARYVRGFTQKRVPDRENEWDGTTYAGDVEPDAEHKKGANCTNPIFAASLPGGAPGEDRCALPGGTRSKELVYFALIGGVPWQLLTDRPNDLSANVVGRAFKAQLDAQDWQRLVGADPERYDTTGQHPLMQESITARTGAETDEAHDRDWNTGGKDLEYACTFALPQPRDCTGKGASCDCAEDSDSPLCDASNKRLQVRGKAYPTLRQLRVAKGLGEQGIVASICPPDPKNKELGGKPNPLYGYRPAVRSIVDRLAKQIGHQCLPDELTPETDGRVPCLVLESFAESVRCADKGLEDADPRIAERFRADQRAELGKDAPVTTVCEAPQILPAQFVGDSCEESESAGWCYVTGEAAGLTCNQAIKFSAKGSPAGANIVLQCIKSSAKPVASPAR